MQYNRHGAAGLRLTHKGSSGFLSKEDKQQVLGWIREQSPSISRETLEAYPESNYGVSYKNSRSYCQLINKAGLPYKKRQAVNPAKDEQKVLERREELKKVLEHEAETESGELAVVVVDECHPVAGDASGYGWGRNSEWLTVQVANPEKRQSCFGALDAKRGEAVLSEAECANSHTTVGFLETLLKHYTGKQLWVIRDNASYHRSQPVRAYLENLNGQLPKEEWPDPSAEPGLRSTLLHFAPNAPEQNPIEAVWLQGKSKVRHQAGLNCFQQVKQLFVDTVTENTCSFDKF